MVERLFEHLTLDGAAPFLVYYGEFVNDLFCGTDYAFIPLDIALWRFLLLQQYQMQLIDEGKLTWNRER